MVSPVVDVPMAEQPRFPLHPKGTNESKMVLHAPLGRPKNGVRNIGDANIP